MAPEAIAALHAGGGPSRAAKKAGVLLAGLFLLPLLAVGTVLLVLAGAGAGAAPTGLGCGGSQVVGVALDGEQMVNARTVVQVTAGRDLPVRAGVIAVATAYTESTLHNSTVATDHDSEGLFQQRVSIYTQAVADDPVRATDAFLDRLIGVPDWQTGDPGAAAQAVQASAYPDRYDTHMGLAEQLAGQLWPAASASAVARAVAGPGAPAADVALRTDPTPHIAPTPPSGPAPVAAAPAGPAGAASPRPTAGTSAGPSSGTRAGTRAGTTPPARVACTGGGNPVSPPGGTGNNVAGQVTVPAGFLLTGSTAAQAAVRFALGQLGKPYVYGAAGPDSWDCSGLTMAAWATQGVALAHYTGTQARQGTPLPLDPSGAAGGDLVLIAGSDGTAEVPGHVGMIAGTSPGPGGRTETWIVQAPMTGIPVELTDATEWAGQVVAVRHLA